MQAAGSQQLERLERLQRADHARRGTQHAWPLAHRVGALGGVRERAAVAGRLPRPDRHHEPAEADDPALHERHAGRAAGGVDRVAGVEGVGAVDDEVLAVEHGGVEGRLIGLDDYLRKIFSGSRAWLRRCAPSPPRGRA